MAIESQVIVDRANGARWLVEEGSRLHGRVNVGIHEVNLWSPDAHPPEDGLRGL